MIDFLSGKLLFALFGMGIPVLIHFLGRKKLKKIPFSSTQWLKAIQSRTMRRLKVKQWILLVLRCLVILFLVLAFARPTVRRSGAAGTGNAAASAVLVVDRSLSMRAGDRFQEAQDRGRAVLDLLGPDDAAALVWTMDGPAHVPVFSRSASAIRDDLFKTVPSFGRGNPLKDLDRAFGQLDRSASLNCEVYFISDFQASELVQEPDSGRPVMNRANLFLLHVADDGENTAVVDAGVENALLQPGLPVRFYAEIRHFGRKTVEDLLVRLFLDNVALSQRTVTLRPGASERIVFETTLDRMGWTAGSVRIENDNCPADNERFFVLHIPERIRALVVGRSDDDTRPFRLALQPDSSLHPLFDVTVRRASGSWVDGLTHADVVLFAHIPVLGPEESGALLSFLTSGGGVFLTAGDGVDVGNVNGRLLEPAAGLTWGPAEGGRRSPASGDRKSPASGDRSSGAVFGMGDADWGHPLFSGVFERGEENVSGLRLYRRVVCRGTNQKPILRFQDGETLLAEVSVGQGRLLVLTSGAEEAWSNLAASALFVPLVVRSALFLSQSAEVRDDALVGSRIVMPLDRLGEGPYRVVDPQDREIFLEPERKDGRFRLSFGKPETPGIFHWYCGETLLGLSAVNPDPRESDLTPVDEDFWKDRFPGVRTSSVSRTEGLRTVVMQTRYGRELWRECLLSGVFCLLAEMIVILWKTPSGRESISKGRRKPLSVKSGPF